MSHCFGGCWSMAVDKEESKKSFNYLANKNFNITFAKLIRTNKMKDMKKNQIKKVLFLIFFVAICLPTFAQNNQQQQERPQSLQQKFQHQGQGGAKREFPGFRRSPLEGIWQACTVKEEGGKVHMQLIPCLKLVGSTGMYQDVTVNTSAEGSVVTENGTYFQLNDSTFKREIFACTDTIASKKYDKTIRTAVQGNNWMVISYSTVDGKDGYQEVWKRISSTAPIPMMRGMSRMMGSRGGNNQSQDKKSSQRQRNFNSNSNNANDIFYQEEINNAMNSFNDDSF